MRILTTFFDDTTLLWSSKLQRALRDDPAQITMVEETASRSASELSQRQRLDSGATITDGPCSPYTEPGYLEQFDLVVTCKPSRELSDLVLNAEYRGSNSRPRFIAFHPGLSLTPEKGISNRRAFDAVVTNSRLESIRARAWLADGSNVVDWYQPALAPLQTWCGTRPDEIRRLVYFTQAESPASATSRLFIADLLRTFAEHHPDIETEIKLRAAPDENRGHVHQERFGYVDLIGPTPPNLSFSTAPAESFFRADTLTLGCTTTVVSEAISHGTPTLCYLDYPEWWTDALNLPMRRLMTGSGIATTVDAIFERQTRPPERRWLEENFRDDDFAVFFDKLIARL